MKYKKYFFFSIINIFLIFNLTQCERKYKNGNFLTVYADDKVDLSSNLRFKRETTFKTDATHKKKISEPGRKPSSIEFPLKDPHHVIIIGWAGEGSRVIVCVTKDNKQTVKSTSNIYISYDYGSVYKNKTSEFKISEEKYAVIHKFYKNEKFTDRFLFADTINNYIFVTMDYGHTILKRELLFSPTEVLTHPTNALIFAVLDTNDKERTLWITTDFGETWRAVSTHVKSYTWSDKTSPPTLYVERAEPNSEGIVLSFHKFPRFEELEKKIVATGVKDFVLKDDYMFAVKKKQRLFGAKPQNDNTLQLWISYKRGPFLLSEFPNKLTHQHYHVADVAYGQIMVCVFHGISSNLYVSSIPADQKSQIKFSLSLERILYFDPNTNWNNTWLNDVADEAFVDLHRVQGIRGVLLASQLVSNFVGSELGLEHVTTLISFNQGGEWRPIRAPMMDHQGAKTNCDVKKRCSLHISQQLASYFPSSKNKPILTGKSAPGLIIVSGTLGTSLKGHIGVFISTDAGVNWHQVLLGNYLFTYGDHGGVLVAVEHYPFNAATNSILYSTDEGETWHSYKFSEEKVKVYGLMVEPGENATIFTIFGSPEAKHEWVLIKINMKPVFLSSCTKEDYKKWSPTLMDSSNGFLCLLGRKDVFERRIPHSNCYNGIDYDRPIEEQNCPCARQDYECDFGYINKHHICQKDATDVVPLLSIPMSCRPGNFYNRTKGYRKIPGDTCVGGLNALYDPSLLPCPLTKEIEFLLVSMRSKILRYDLLNPNASLQALPVMGLQGAIALDFDVQTNCLLWSDASTNRIMRQCFDGNHSQEVLVSSNVDSVEGLALDWVSNNLYFVDGERTTVEVIRLDSNHSSRLRTTVLKHDDKAKVTIGLPRGIAVHPVKGYMFLTDWSEKNPMVARASLDGSDLKVLFGSDKVFWPNGITIDFQTERIFWVDANLDYIASSDLNGNYFKKIVEHCECVKQPFAVGVYKNMMFWDDWGNFQVFQADKTNGLGRQALNSQPMVGLVDLKVYGHLTQKGSNACGDNNNCQFLCMGMPNNGHVCLCPDWMKTVKDKETNENKCLCADDSVPDAHGGCKTNSNHKCEVGFFKCDTNICVLEAMRCDKVNDCGDFSDEKDCNSPSCDAASWQCTNLHCISPAWKCDTDNDCGDNSDEEGCDYPKCKDTEFTCNNKRCIDKKWVCDQTDDCRDGSDEANCADRQPVPSPNSCSDTKFTCLSDNTCLPISWQCDGEPDCRDKSDEDLTKCANHTCDTWQFQCHSKKCIYKSWKCDGEKDCTDGEDEEGCAPIDPPHTIPPPPEFPLYKNNDTCEDLQFRCGSGFCIPYWWRCDNAGDCPDGSDEENCENKPVTTPAPFIPAVLPPKPPCSKDQMECENGDCVWLAWVCDNDVDCPAGDDEKNCSNTAICSGTEEFRCWHSEGCVDMKKRCDGHSDCADETDELGCVNTTVPSSGEVPAVKNCDVLFFACDGGYCLPLTKFCDKNFDCLDMTDEINCTTHGNKWHEAKNLHLKKVMNTSLTFGWEVSSGDKVPLEFKASTIVKARLGNPNAVQNGSWIDSMDYTFENLLPFTEYLLSVYVRENETKQEFYPVSLLSTHTAIGIPSPPVNIRAEQVNTYEVRVFWDPPHQPNGQIVTYQVYASPPRIPNSPPRIPKVYKVEAPLTEIVVGPSTTASNLTFWLTTSNSEYTSLYSEMLHFTLAGIRAAVSNLHVEPKETLAHLKWDPLEGVDTYRVVYKDTSTRSFTKVDTTLNVTDPFADLSFLAPGTTYTVHIFGVKGSFIGPVLLANFTTTGEKLPPVQNLQYVLDKEVRTTINLLWKEPSYGEKEMWNYEVAWGKTIIELEKGLYSNFTKKLFFKLSGLDACEQYLVSVKIAGPIGNGPAKIIKVTTKEDVLAPPKKVKAWNVAGKMMVTWTSSCSLEGDSKLRYLLNITETTMNTTVFFDVGADQLTKTNNFSSQMHDSGRYILTVRTSLNNSRPSPPVAVNSTEIPAPFELTFNPSDGSFFWRNHMNISTLKLKESHSYMLYMRRVDSGKEVAVEVTEAPYQDLEMDPGHIYLASVAFKDKDGYLSQKSQEIRVEKSVGDGIVISENSVVGVTVTVIIVLVILVAAISFMAIRHKRLARSFSSFANSHYDRFQGTTSIATDHNLDEDDSPVIRGFSDDEPLVMA